METHFCYGNDAKVSYIKKWGESYRFKKKR